MVPQSADDIVNTPSVRISTSGKVLSVLAAAEVALTEESDPPGTITRTGTPGAASDQLTGSEAGRIRIIFIKKTRERINYHNQYEQS